MKSDQENPVKKTKTASRQKSVSGKAVVNSKDPGEGVVLLVPMIPLRLSRLLVKFPPIPYLVRVMYKS